MTDKSIRCGSYPFMNIAQDFGLPYGVVLLMSDHIEKSRWDEHTQRAASFAKEMMNCDEFEEFIQVMRKSLNATRNQRHGQ